MALVVSNFDVGETIDVTDGQCPTNSVCGTYTTTLSNFQWTSDDAIEEDRLVIGVVADKIDRCDDPLCTACHETYWTSDPSQIEYQCTDYTRYKYSNQCNNWKNKDNLCGAEDLCFRSWAADDPKKWKSPEAACRPLPEPLYEGEFKYGKSECRDTRGLCALGCGEGTCYNSFPIDDPLKWKSPAVMCRCKDAQP